MSTVQPTRPDHGASAPPPTRPPERVYVLGCGVSRITLAGALDRIEAWIAAPAPAPRYVVATGFHGIHVAAEDPEFRRILNGADLFCPDGIAPVIVSRLRGDPLPERVPGPDILRGFLARADARGYASYFYGDTEPTLAALRERLAREYPGHRVAGTCSPPFRPLTDAESDRIVADINASGAHVLWVGLGLPKQERWIAAHIDRLEVPVIVAVGAAFGFESGRVSRAPALVGRLGLEWAWRLAAEPRKLWRRTLVQGPRFLWRVLLEITGLRKYPR